VLIVPAMETGMYLHPATQEHLSTLRERGATIMTPGEGHLASGAAGVGRLPEVPEMLAAIRSALGKEGPLAGKRVVVTAGGTREPLDPVRFIGNGSSGRMGYAVAEEALYAGAGVTLISGTSSVQPPHGVTLVRVETTAEMEKAVHEAIAGADILIMAAAVADYTPRHRSEQKIKKSGDTLTVEMARTPDILGGLAEMELPGLVRVGFAAETQDLEDNAREKLRKKKLDLIVANDAVASIGAEASALVLIGRDGTIERLPPMPKSESARILVERSAALLR
jgi:phosphopantothenoylcysteine decarboxylase / phosphopantothenate---cysteine ligase